MNQTKIQSTSGQDRVIVPARRSKRTFWLVGLAICFLGWVLYSRLSLWSKADLSFERDQLRYATVERGSLVQDLSVEGRIIASSYPTLYSPAQGMINLNVKAGDPVERGTLLGVIDSPELTSTLEQESSSLASLQAGLAKRQIEAKVEKLERRQDVELKKARMETAKRELNRTQQLAKEQLASALDLDKATDELTLSQLEYNHAVERSVLDDETLTLDLQNEQRQADRQALVLAEAQRRVDALKLTSPVTGVVGSVSVDPKDNVALNQVLLTVIDLSAFEISISVPETYADQLSIGAPAEITYEGKPYQGIVTSFSPEVNNASVEGRVAFDGGLPHGLKQNQRVNTRLILSARDNVLTVKRGPFLESGAGRSAWLLKDQLAVLQPISVGASSLTAVEITSGLSEGDVIVISDTSRFASAKSVYLKD